MYVRRYAMLSYVYYMYRWIGRWMYRASNSHLFNSLKYLGEHMIDPIFMLPHVATVATANAIEMQYEGEGVNSR